MKAPILVLLFCLLSKTVLAQDQPLVPEDRCLQQPDPGLCKAYTERYFYNSTSDSCQLFIWGGCDGTVPFETLARCETAQCGVPRCQQQPDSGPCRGLFRKYFYNQTSDMCEEFIWGGCRGNVPFDTLQQCKRCNSRCNLEPDSGPCRAFIPSYFYNATSMMCEEFIYGGCQGVVPFDTLVQCEGACVDPCVEIPDPGPCRTFSERYFFNPTTGECEMFIWGGCQGNIPFETLDECEKAECRADEGLIDVSPMPDVISTPPAMGD